VVVKAEHLAQGGQPTLRRHVPVRRGGRRPHPLRESVLCAR
jgi:hypothetical protein